jgi:NosR/NirI family nitrous oxide reductase transcriptional regulator
LNSRLPRYVAILAAAVAGCALLYSAQSRAATSAPTVLDCEQLACAQVLPRAARFEPVPNANYWAGHDADGNGVGWVALSTDFVNIKAYSGKPLVTLVGLDPQGTITGARVIHHSEPILLIGIPESELHDFVDSYAGKQATQRIVVGRTKQPDAISVDAISGATVTVLAQNQTILEVARAVGVQVGVVRVTDISPGHFVSQPKPWTFEQMVDRGALGRLTVSKADMGVSDSSEPFVDLYFGIADAPHIGGALIRPGDYKYYMSQLEEGEHLFVMLGRGSSSFKGSAFVRGGVFDRVRLVQGLREITFRDTDYYNLPDTPAEGAPEFQEGAVFIARGGLLDPGTEYDVVFLGSRYDRRGAFSRDFREFSASHRLPSSVYQIDGGRDLTIWQQAWLNRQVDAIILVCFLLAVIGVFIARRYTTADPRRLARLHISAMVFSFVVIGLYMRSQPSVTQVLTLIESSIGEWRWELFLSEPLLFIFWIFITITTLIWGRGVFCGWVCPYGLMTELVFKISTHFGIPNYELPDRWHLKLRYLRYAILVVLVPVFLWDSILGEKLAEIEPFKSTFLVPAWKRSGLFFSWWLLLLGLSVFMYRPFCRYICPLGGGLAILSSFRFSGPRRRRFCSSCKICTRGCEPRAIRENGSINPRECLSCMECESNYRAEKICPPLIGIQGLEVKGDLNHREGRKLEQLKLDRERV